MTLVPPDKLQEIIGKALQSGLQDRRRALIAALGERYAGTLEIAAIPTDQLLLDLFAMNSVTRPVAGMIPLQVWLATAATLLQPLPEAAFFDACAKEIVPQADPTIEQAKENAEATLKTLHDWAEANPALRAAVKEASEELDAISKRLRPFAALKRVHDLLHDFQITMLPLLQATIQQAPADNPLVQMTINSAVNRINTLVTAGRNEVEQLVIEREKDEQAEYLDELERVGASLTQAAKARSTEQAQDGLFALRGLLRTWMPNLNLRLSYKAEELHIDGLIEHLRSFASQSLKIDDPRAAKVREAATQLGLLHDEIRALLDEHDKWQRIDNDLWAAEENLLFREESSRALRDFSQQWPSVVQKVERLAGSAPWYASVQQHAVSFVTYCPMPATPPIKPDAITEFQEYINSTRLQFFMVDSELNRRCTRLSQITDPLEDLARSF